MNQAFALLRHDVFNPSTPVGALAWGVAFFCVALAVSHGIRRVADRIEAQLTDPTGLPFIASLAQVLVYLVSFVLYAHLVPELRTIGTALLAGAGVVSIVAGLAAQNTLGNLVAGLSLVLYRPIRVNDSIQVKTPGGFTTATVVRISLGFTVLRAAEGAEVIVPNNVMMSTVLVRFPQHDPSANTDKICSSG